LGPYGESAALAGSPPCHDGACAFGGSVPMSLLIPEAAP
jgi:hypothetical protein